MKNIIKIPQTGFGFDGHEFSASGILALGGIKVKGYPALRGHSDGDVIVHAVIDALLGGAGLGDIGEMFPDSNKRIQGIASLRMLEKVLKRIGGKGFAPYYVDVTVVADKPRLSSLKVKIRKALAKNLGLKINAVNIKAKTSEGTRLLSPQGSVVAWAVATLIPK